VWVFVLGAGVAVGERQSTLGELMDAVVSGEVSEVHVAGVLPAGASGYATVDVRWRQGLFLHHAAVVQASPGYEQEAQESPSESVTTTDVATLIRGQDPTVQVQVSEVFAPSGGSILGWDVPSWLMWFVLAGMAVTLWRIVNGPEPWRATRWAWAWALFFTGPVGAGAFAVLAGPTPGLPGPKDGNRRLSGGWAVLLLLLLSPVLVQAR